MSVVLSGMDLIFWRGTVKNEVVEKSFYSADGQTKATAQVELFTWEKLDFVDTFKNAFGL